MGLSVVALVVLVTSGIASAGTPSPAGVFTGAVTGSHAARQRDRMLAPDHLPDVNAIRTWAERESWGGNQVDVFTSGKNKIVVARRAFSSGIQTCGLNVFIPADGGWEPSLALRPVSGFWLRVTQDGDTVRIVNAKTGAEVARISIVGLQAN